VEVEVIRSGGRLALRFAVTGDIADLAIPELANPGRAHELWKHTCFEVFMRTEQGEGYYEFNFSPTGQWAAYHFAGYRFGRTDIAGASDPGIGTRAISDRFEIRASIDLDRIPELAGPWMVGLSIILEQSNGNKSFWALRHPPGKPDFHHADCFALRLPSAESA
jgi:hypothetical protein